MSGGGGKKNNMVRNAVIAGTGSVIVPAGGCMAIIVLIVVVILAGAGGILGWLFGGSAPDGPGNANSAPGSAVNFWTPTPVPGDCYITPTPVSVIIQPTAAPGGTATPPPPTPTAHTEYLPTPTACPRSQLQGTPNPAYPPVGTTGQGNYDVRHGTISLATVQQVLNQWPAADGNPNPLTPYAQRFVDFGQRYGLNPAYALAMAIQESGLCTTGISPTAIECFNIIWTSGGNCVSHNYAVGHDFCGYASWSDALEAWFKLIAGYYIPNNLTTVGAIVNVYAPCSDNGGCGFTQMYINHVETWVSSWGVQPEATSADDVPHGSPFRSSYIVTQAYGCTDFPEFQDAGCVSSSGGRQPYFHRGVDMVATGDKTVYSTMAGTVIFAGFNSDGFGNRIYLKQGPYLVIYPHLSRIMVEPGQTVGWGVPIGVEGSTGYSTGDHVHYEIHINSAWVDSTPYLMRP